MYELVVGGTRSRNCEYALEKTAREAAPESWRNRRRVRMLTP